MSAHVVGAHGKKERAVYGMSIQELTQIWDAISGPPEAIYIDPEAYLHGTSTRFTLYVFLSAVSGLSLMLMRP